MGVRPSRGAISKSIPGITKSMSIRVFEWGEKQSSGSRNLEDKPNTVSWLHKVCGEGLTLPTCDRKKLPSQLGPLEEHRYFLRLNTPTTAVPSGYAQRCYTSLHHHAHVHGYVNQVPTSGVIRRLRRLIRSPPSPASRTSLQEVACLQLHPSISPCCGSNGFSHDLKSHKHRGNRRGLTAKTLFILSWMLG